MYKPGVELLVGRKIPVVYVNQLRMHGNLLCGGNTVIVNYGREIPLALGIQFKI